MNDIGLKKMKLPTIKIVYFGTPEISAGVLKKISEEKAKIIGVFTKPDSLYGRGTKTQENPVKKLAKELKIPIFQPKLLKNVAVLNNIKNLSPDLIIVAAYGLIIPKEILDIPKYGVLNIHPSLLPMYRGPSPVATALMNGDSYTGVSIMLLDQGMDSGPVLVSKKININSGHNTQTLTQELFQIGADLLIETMKLWIDGQIEPKYQNINNISVTSLLTKEDGKINWQQKNEQIERKVRAFSPWPTAFTYFKSKRLIIEKAFLFLGENTNQNNGIIPGTVIKIDTKSKSIVGVCCGEGFLVITRVKLEGSSSQDINDFIRGKSDFIGGVLQ
tara:strand:- start:750 stop:1742 length:993 start_codon:yes stop_codon:yes gene_type:complete